MNIYIIVGAIVLLLILLSIIAIINNKYKVNGSVYKVETAQQRIKDKLDDKANLFKEVFDDFDIELAKIQNDDIHIYEKQLNDSISALSCEVPDTSAVDEMITMYKQYYNQTVEEYQKASQKFFARILKKHKFESFTINDAKPLDILKEKISPGESPRD